jgi:hypothetical protein
MSDGAISHQTVRNMMRGAVPYAEHIVELVKALENDQEERKLLADELLRLGAKEFAYVGVMHAWSVGARPVAAQV